jgi:hypothetical protein
MAERKPLVLDDNAQLQQLQPGDDLDVPLEQRFDELEHKFKTLVTWLLLQGFQVPENLIE